MQHPIPQIEICSEMQTECLCKHAENTVLVDRFLSSTEAKDIKAETYLDNLLSNSSSQTPASPQPIVDTQSGTKNLEIRRPVVARW